MPFVLLDDAFPDHPKVEQLTDAAFRLHVAGICYAGRLLTDGHITLDRVRRLVGRFKAKALDELLAADIWHPHGATCLSPICQPAAKDAIYIHDFLAINRSKAKADAGREAAAERQRRYRARTTTPGDTVSNAVTDGVSDAAQAKPSRAEGSPQPPAERGAAPDPEHLNGRADRFDHHGQHPNCRACGTNRRPLRPAPTPPDRPQVPDWTPTAPIDRAPMPPDLRALIRKEPA